MQRALRYFLVVGGATVAILLFLLASASDNSASFDKHYPWLLGLNALVTVALLLLVLLLLMRLYSRYKRGLFGSRLMAKLVLLFALVGILPGVVIYTVSVNSRHNVKASCQSQQLPATHLITAERNHDRLHPQPALPPTPASS